MKTSIKSWIDITGETCPIDLAGANIKGVQYYDFEKIQFINSSGIADLIAIIKVWMKNGNLVRFVNVPESIKKNFIEMGLENIIHVD